MFQSCLKATLSYWKEVTGQYWDKILVRDMVFGQFVINIGDSLEHLSEYYSIF